MGDTEFRHGRKVHIVLARGLVFLSLILSVPSICCGWQGATVIQDPYLGHYLSRLNLQRLRNVHLENRLAHLSSDSEESEYERLSIATELAESYINQITSNIDDDEKQTVHRGKLANLQTACPQLAHPRIDAAILTADFAKIQADFFRWRSNTSNLQLAKSLEKEIQNALTNWIKNSEVVSNRIIELTAKSEKSFGGIRFQQSLEQFAALESQLKFVGGWIKYYEFAFLAGSTRQNEAKQLAILNQAEQVFLELLQFKSIQDLIDNEFDPDEFGLSWVSRSVLGLAMISTAKGNQDDAELLFSILKKSDQATSILADVDWWTLQAAAISGKWQLATRLAQRKIVDSGLEEVPHTRYWLACITLSTETTTPKLETIGLATIGMQGLLREDRFALAEKMVKDKSIQLPKSSFTELWFQGYRSYELANDNQNPKSLQTAERMIEQAILIKQPTVTRLDLAKCRYLLAWIKFRLEKNSEAEKLFRIASLGLRSIDEANAAKALWVRIVSLKKLATVDPSYNRRIPTAINELIRLYPRTSYAEKAAFEQARFQFDDADPQKAIEKLGKLPDSHPSFVQAQLEILRLKHNILLATSSSSNTYDSRLSEFHTLTESFLSICPDNERCAQAISMLVDIHLAGTKPNTEEVTQWLSRAKSYVERLAESNSITADFRFQKYRVATLMGNTTVRDEEIKWLTSRNNSVKHYKVAVLIDQARALEKKINNSTDMTEKTALLRRSYGINQSLLNLFGSEKKHLLENQNARIICSKIAEIESELGLTEQAITRLEQLYELFSERREYVYRLAKLYSKTASDSKALPLWIKLGKGTEAGSEMWLESKYHSIEIQSRKHDDNGGDLNLRLLQILRQSQTLAPKMSEVWKRKFKDLESRLLENQ